MPINLQENSSLGKEVSVPQKRNWASFLLGLIGAGLVIAAGFTVLEERRFARDVVRISDIRMIQTALSLYRDDHNRFPDSLSEGQPLTSEDGRVYLTVMPKNPTPGGIPYTYQPLDGNTSYQLFFSLEGPVGEISSGPRTATPRGIE